MLKRVIFLLALGCAAAFAADKLNGAGASFPYPAYSSWAYFYEKETGNQINYQSIGSGGGIQQVTKRVVDFGASDEPLNKNGIDDAKVFQFPTLIGSIVLSYNIHGIEDGQLKLTNEIVAKIFAGEITKWNDPQISCDNQDLKLPDEDIVVIRRSDGSGTTFNFTTYLSKVSKNWADSYGAGKTVDWPVGIAGKGNEGIVSLIKQTPNSIGYLENVYAIQNTLPRITLKTKSGKWVTPSNDNFRAAAKQAKWSGDNDFYQMLILQDGDNAYPIVAATFILLPKDREKMNKKITMFFNWAFEKGDEEIMKLGYIPLPIETKNLIRKYWKDNKISM